VTRSKYFLSGLYPFRSISIQILDKLTQQQFKSILCPVMRLLITDDSSTSASINEVYLTLLFPMVQRCRNCLNMEKKQRSNSQRTKLRLDWWNTLYTRTHVICNASYMHLIYVHRWKEEEGQEGRSAGRIWSNIVIILWIISPPWSLQSTRASESEVWTELRYVNAYAIPWIVDLPIQYL